MQTQRWSWHLACLTAVAFGLGVVNFGWADEKKDPPKGKDSGQVIVIQLDASKLPPDMLKKLIELAGTQDKKPATTKEPEKKPEPKKEPEKKPEPKKEPEKKPEPKKDETKKPNIIQVDLNKLSPDLAKRLQAELAASSGKGDKKPEPKKEDEKKPEGKKGDENKDGDNNNKDDDDKKGDAKKPETKKGDEKKGGKEKDD